jgi:hypothetical protein
VPTRPRGERIGRIRGSITQVRVDMPDFARGFEIAARSAHARHGRVGKRLARRGPTARRASPGVHPDRAWSPRRPAGTAAPGQDLGRGRRRRSVSGRGWTRSTASGGKFHGRIRSHRVGSPRPGRVGVRVFAGRVLVECSSGAGNKQGKTQCGHGPSHAPYPPVDDEISRAAPTRDARYGMARRSRQPPGGRSR